MLWFDRIFPVLMVVHPLVFALCTRTKNELDEGARRSLSRMMNRLLLATAFFLVLHIAVQAGLEATQAYRNLWRALWPPLISVSGCLVLWTAFAGRAMAAKNAAFNSPARLGLAGGNGETAAGMQRSASLVPRHLASPIGPRAWFVGWVFFAVCAVVSIWTITQGAPWVLLLGCGWWIGMAVGGARQTLTEAEPRDAAGSPKVDAAYRSLRAFRSWCFYSLGLSGTLVFTLVSVLVLLWPSASGMLGGILGSALGLAGAAFGVLAAWRRVKVNELLIEANREALSLPGGSEPR